MIGHDATIKETQRLTDKWAELNDDRKELLNETLQIIWESLFSGKGEHSLPEIMFTYFKPDEKKSGGTYLSIQGKLKR